MRESAVHSMVVESSSTALTHNPAEPYQRRGTSIPKLKSVHLVVDSSAYRSTNDYQLPHAQRVTHNRKFGLLCNL